ncbi:hypothetical protein CPB83DRAFT_861801 [Crepidotus variabilis]|uniref:Nephrocystin 3-like N-terminal domain-containing protein n=1 Tax=Crepidotus variabilis TaxID=179855 RepID=A0A9P6E7X6_9AGAR|nr:hypothetical protein CPB83DRAFT_861801 [Crepidotus variabilis]
MANQQPQREEKKSRLGRALDFISLSSSKVSISPTGSLKESKRKRFKKLLHGDHGTVSSRSASPLPSTSLIENRGDPPIVDHAGPSTSPGPPPGQPPATSLGTQVFQELANEPAEPQSHSAASNAEPTIMDNVKLTGRFLLTIIQKVPDIVDDNPVKLAFGLASAIIQAKEMVQDNKDAVVRQILSTGDQLNVVEKALEGWRPHNKEEERWIGQFGSTLKEQLEELLKLKDESTWRKILDHEDEQKRIEEIFGRVNTARERFELATGIRVFKIVHEIQEELRESLLERLKASPIADHKYHLEGEEGKKLRRQICTPGTRVRILDNIIVWANNTSPESPDIYWLSGRAGSGKSTIAYTIARRFELAPGPADTITLGGNFFCSRQFSEVSESKRIIRTIVYHLSLRCKPFADALSRSGKFDTVNQSVRAQLKGLLIEPWQASERARCPDPSTPAPPYLIVIDALDEIDGSGGSEFLRDLLLVIDENKNRLNGLKFFITSRPDPALVKDVNSLKRKEFYRLEEVLQPEARYDIKTYLTTELDHFKGREEIDQLATLAGELFIYAATVVKHLAARGRSEQEKFLKVLVNPTDASDPRPLSDSKAFMLLDTLYSEILAKAFHGFEEGEWRNRCDILHTLLCTADRTSTSVVTNLLFTDDYTDVAHTLLNHLHAVLYVEGGKVLWYHKSFPDFIFTKARSKAFWCNEAAHHRLLTTCCFRVMEEGLKFNIAEISSSFVLDNKNPALPDKINECIGPVLRYSCRNWIFHLSTTTLTMNDPLLGTLSDFLDLRILFWIETMNLLKLHGHCGPMLQVAHQWVKNSKNSMLSEQIAEAASFALYFSGSPTVLSMPHLYISSLATWPRNLEPCQKWRSHFSRIPGFINASQSGTCLMALELDCEVWAVAFSSDGRHIISGSEDQSVRMWDASTGEELKVLNGHSGGVSSVAFSSDGKHIISGSVDKSVRVWDASTGEELKELKVLNCHSGGFTSVAFSSDGKHIISGSYDRYVRVWDASTGEELKVLNGHSGGVSSVAFSSDGKHIISGSDDKSVRVDGKHIISGSDDKSVRVWDASTGEELKVLNGHSRGVTSVAYSSDGKHIISGSYDKSLRVWDASTGEELKVLDHSAGVMSVAFSTDDKRIISGLFDGSVQVGDASTGKELKALNSHMNSVSSTAFSSDGQHTFGSNDQSVPVWGGKPQYIRERTWHSYGQTQNLKYTGWLLSPNHKVYLMFVPLAAQLPDPANIMTLPTSAASHVDFTNARLGDQWHECYSPVKDHQ